MCLFLAVEALKEIQPCFHQMKTQATILIRSLGNTYTTLLTLYPPLPAACLVAPQKVFLRSDPPLRTNEDDVHYHYHYAKAKPPSVELRRTRTPEPRLHNYAGSGSGEMSYSFG